MSQIPRLRSKRKISLPVDENDDDIRIEYEAPRRPWASQPVFARNVTAKNPSSQEGPMFEQVAPRMVSELAINPKKGKELSEWIRDRHLRIGFLLVKGPSGSGKTTAVTLTAKQEGFFVSKWTEIEEISIDEWTGLVSEASEISSFFDFLKGGCASRSLESSKPSIIVVDYIPYSVLRNIQEFHSQLKAILSFSRHSIIFCVTDLDSCWELSCRRIFPPTFLSDNHMTTMTFQPIADTFLNKGMTNAVHKLRRCKVSPSLIKQILGISKGNILTALNVLQFSRDLNGDVVSICPALQAALEDDMFHMLGRLLYAKRIDSKIPASDLSLSRNNQRPLSERNVNDVLQLSNTSDSTVSLFLHEHGIKFSPSISASRRILENISFADSLTSRWDIVDRTYQYSSQIHARSCMFYNYGRSGNNGMYKFFLPQWIDVLKECRINIQEASDVIVTGAIGSELWTLQIPLMKAIRPDLFPGQEEIVSYLSRPMGFSRLAGRVQWRNSRRLTHKPRSPISSVLPTPSKFITENEELFKVDISDSDDDNKCDELYDSFYDPVEFTQC